MIYVERKEHFNASHQLYNPSWSKERNREVFGKCANENFHGHNYILTVTVKGEIDPDNGFVINLADLKGIIRKLVIEKLDHSNLNRDVGFMKGKISSTEVLAVEVWKILEPEIEKHRAELHKIRLDETVNNAVEYFG